MPKLTKRIVDSTLPGPKQVLAWDSVVKGFGLRVTSGAKSYFLNHRDATGRERRFTIGRHGSPWTCEEARSEASKLLRGLASGDDPLQKKADARVVTTISDLRSGAGPVLRRDFLDRPSNHPRPNERAK